MKKEMNNEKLEIITPQGIDREDKPGRMKMQKRTSCIRCGKCCKTSGPSLLKEDMYLFTSGMLSYDSVHTIREGELVRSHDNGQVYESFTELIKVRGKNAGPVCIFYHDDEGCRIYQNRPSQCRQYQCWMPVNLYVNLEKDSLVRKELFGSVDVLMEIIEKHEARCSYGALSGAFERIAGGQENAVEDIMDMLQYDTYIRPFLKEKLNVPDEAMDLILGKPLIEAVGEFGFKVVREGDDYILSAIENREDQKQGDR
jgi:Fe-S-cluster containining protein